MRFSPVTVVSVSSISSSGASSLAALGVLSLYFLISFSPKGPPIMSAVAIPKVAAVMATVVAPVRP